MLLYTWTVNQHVTLQVRLESRDELLLEYTKACLELLCSFTRFKKFQFWLRSQSHCSICVLQDKNPCTKHKHWDPSVAYFFLYAAAHLHSSQFWRKNVTVQNCPFPQSLNKEIYVILVINTGCFKICGRKIEILCRKSKINLKQRVICATSRRKRVYKSSKKYSMFKRIISRE
jgi:hypothetical protein